jgi:hypothetical protein
MDSSSSSTAPEAPADDQLAVLRRLVERVARIEAESSHLADLDARLQAREERNRSRYRAVRKALVEHLAEGMGLAREVDPFYGAAPLVVVGDVAVQLEKRRADGVDHWQANILPVRTPAD